MANKREFPKDFSVKNDVKKSDLVLIADSNTKDNYVATVDALTKDKVDKENGKELINSSDVQKLNLLPNRQQLDLELSKKVDKVAGKDLVSNTDIAKLSALPTATELNDKLNTKVDKVAGKELSTNDYSNEDKRKVDIIKTDGQANRYLAENGEYNTVIIPKAPVQSIEVNGQDVPPDGDGKVAITIPKAPVQGIEVNGEIATPNEEGIVSVVIPKAPVQSVSVNTEEIKPDSAGNVNIEINKNVEQTVNPLSDDPVSSSAVASEFAGLSAKYGASVSLTTIGEDDDKKYSISLLDENGNILSTTDEWSGGGGSGAVTTTKIVLNKLSENQTIKLGDEPLISFHYDHISIDTQASTGNPAKITYNVISGASNVSKEITVQANTNTNLDVREFLQLGNNTVRVRAEVDNGESVQVATISWTIQVVNLVLTSNYDFATANRKGVNISVPYTLTGSGNKLLSCYVNNVKIEDKSISTSTSTGSFTIPTSAYSHGNISVQLVAELELVSGNIKSNSIYYDLIITEENVTKPIVSAKYNYQDGTIIESGKRPYISALQFEDYNINYAVYDPAKPFPLVVVEVDGDVISTATVSFIQQRVTHRSLKTGDLNASIKTGSLVYSFGVKVGSSSIGLTEPTDDLVFKFSAIGKSNNDVNKEVWNSTVNNITANLTGVKFGGDGWLNNALRLNDGGKAVINYQPLNATNRLVNNSFAFQVKYRVSDVVDDNAVLISCVDSEGTGFIITPISTKMLTRGKAPVTMTMAPNAPYNITFVSYPTAIAGSSEGEQLNNNMVYLYVNGVMSGCVQRANADNIYQANPVNVTMGGAGATIDIFGTRHYNRYLSDSEAYDLFNIDIEDVKTLIDKYNFNAQIDGQGKVTVDDVPEDMRYVIVTGEAPNGQPVLKYAEVQNNKDNRYDTVEMLHIKKSQPALNFKLIGGCIRLQGTSSLAYARKNFRLYFKNSAKVAGQLYTGVDAQGNGGTLQAKAKWSFKLPDANGKSPAPVDVWCTKADFAESSSSHNTGLARLSNDIYKEIGDGTPAQKKVTPSYKYDVRTAIDGEPCYMFYRKTLADEPVFAGKFNFNNDKSTENVFGFEEIPGYHLTPDGSAPSQWIIDKFGGENPTECWEFLNNDYAMGMFLDDDFDAMVNVDGEMIPNWTRVFEARYPDNQDDYMDGTKKPFYLERLVKWVRSTKDNPTKFKAEVADYFDVNNLTDYYNLTDVFGAVDQRVKNCMLAFFYDETRDKVLAYYIFYDGDTIIALRNDGRLVYDWDIDHNSIDVELSASTGVTKYAFEGHDSVLWNNLRNGMQNELESSYKRIRGKMSNEYIKRYFTVDQTAKFAERIYNIDALYKYVEPKTKGVEVLVGGVITNVQYSNLEALQGNRDGHRDWWLGNRLNLYDGKYSAGEYQATDIAWKGFSQAGAKVSAIPTRDYYFQLRREGTVMTHTLVKKDATWSYTYPQQANIGTIFHLYGGQFMKELNLSEWGGFTDLSLPVLPVLSRLTLGGAVGKTYSLTELVIGNKLPSMKFLDIRNYTNLPSLDLNESGRLEELNARGCNLMSLINFGEGSPLNKLTLPKNLRILKLSSLAYLKTENILFPDGNIVETLIVENSPLVKWETLVDQYATTLKNIRITGIREKGDGTWFKKYENYKGVDENGTIVNYPALIGTYELTKFPDDYDELLKKFPLITFIEPQFSTLSINFEVLDRMNVTNLENNSGYDSGTPYRPTGHFGKILNQRYRALGKQTQDGKMNIIKLNNNNSNFYNDNAKTPAILNGTEGDLFNFEPEYWYKSIQDGANTYLAVSTQAEAPSTPDPSTYRVIDKLYSNGNATYKDDIAENVAFAGSFTNNQITVSGSLVTSPNLWSVKINVKGYKRAYIVHASTAPNTVQNRYVIFADENYQVLKSELVFSNVRQSIQKIVTIPANASYMYVSNLYAYPTIFPMADRIVLTKLDGDNIWDLAVKPWEKHEEELIGVTSLGNNNGKLGSFVTSSQSQKGFSEKFLMDTYLNQRGLNIISYFQYKTMVMSTIMGIGTTKTDLVVGKSNATSNMGITAPCGNRNTFLDPDLSTYYYNDAGEKVRINVANCMGYENVSTKELIMAPVSTNWTVATNTGYRNYPYNLTCGDGVKSKILPSSKLTGNAQTQRYLDSGTFEVMPVADTSGVRGSIVNIDPLNTSRNWMVKGFMLNNEVDGLQVGSTADNAVDYSDPTVTTRIAFPYSDRIVKVESVTAFKNITNFK